MFKNPDDREIRSILEKSKNIAVVGLSPNSERDSYQVALYLVKQGYNVIPVNPSESLIQGRISYRDLTSVPDRIDIVNVFRKSDHLPAIVEEALKVKPLCIWAQLGVVNQDAAEYATAEGVSVVMDRCIKIEHRRIRGEGGK